MAWFHSQGDDEARSVSREIFPPSASEPLIDTAFLRQYAPMDALADESLQRLRRAATMRRLAPGAEVIRAGQGLAKSIWLVGGVLEVDEPGALPTLLNAGDPRARSRIASPLAASATCRARTAVTLLEVDGALLDLVLTWEQSSACEVAGIDDAITDDWMTRLLQAPAFQRLPPTHLHLLFRRLQPVEVMAGERVIQEGDAGDYFYVVVEGRCLIEHRGSHARPLQLATFGPGDCFGEEALIAGLPRNASAIMATDGRLMRLARADFVELLNEPLIIRLDCATAQARVDAGAACWLDVRLPSEFEQGHFPGARNLPLRLLRAKSGSLERELLHICVCDSGRRSAVAAYLLTQRGYSAASLAVR
jgi:CRP-like cAMP-binding protein